MNADGSDRQLVISNGRNSQLDTPRWSPSGTHLTYGARVYRKNSPRPSKVDVYRATADGGDETNLTGDTGEVCVPVAWRDE